MAAPDAAALRRMFELATTIRACDERFRTMMATGQIFILYYSPAGQEMIASAFGTVLRPDDYVVTTYRGVHDQIAKGVPLRPLWAEFLGRQTGTCKGKGGPMHLTDPASGLMVTTGVVGSGLPIANGLALASKVLGADRVTVVNFGDGATNIGAFHEALNLASVWKLPVVFVCQNNRYAEHTPYADGTSVQRVSDRAAAYSMPGVTVDGNDAVAMYEAAYAAVARARAGEGPTLVEALTFRFHGHIVGDMQEYMPKEELEAAVAADPLPAYRRWLLAEGHLSEDDATAIEAQAAADVDDAVQFALESPPPPPEELFLDVYAEALV